MTTHMNAPASSVLPWTLDPSIGLRSRIRQYQDRVDQRYAVATCRFQMTWGLLARMVYKDVVALLCRISVLPFVMLCKLGRYHFLTVIQP